jgi:FkbM family methyltransferase
VRVLHYGAYSRKGKIKLYLPEGEKGFTIYNTLMSCRARAGERYVEVSGDTLDNIINKAGLIPSEINWIKIDVEGAEFEVLNGAHSILSEARELSILIEVHGIKNVLLIKNLLNSYGFQIEYESTHEGAWRHVIFKKYV